MSAETLRKAAAQIRNDHGGIVSKNTRDGRRWLPVAEWLDDIATRHAEDPEPVELVLHYDEECPTGECVEPGYHEGCIVCTGCFPSYEGMDGRSLWPCIEFKSALAVATAYLGSDS